MRQHYIPKFIVEGFVTDDSSGNRGVWLYSATRKKWDRRPTTRVASAQDFYSFIEASGERDDQLEQFLESIETPVAKLLKRDILARNPLQPPHPDDIFVTFCALLIMRNPATISRTKAVLVNNAKDHIDEITSSHESFQAFRRDFAAKTGRDFPNIIEFQRLRTDFEIGATKSAGLGFSLAASVAIREDLGRMAVDFMFAPAAGPRFITGDVPFVIINSETDKTKFDQVVIPLSAEVTAIFNASDQPEYGYLTASSSNVCAVNRAMLGVAQNFIISSTRDPFPSEILDRWAEADRDGRIEIVRELMLQEMGA